MQQGFYTDPPGRKMAYDEDGTVVYRLDPTNTLIPIADAAMVWMNAESHGSGSASGLTWGQLESYGYLIFMFPELRDVTHIYSNMYPQSFNSSTTTPVEYSMNSTNGADGDWTVWGNISALLEPGSPNYRERITHVPLSGVKMIRIYYGFKGAPAAPVIGNVHIYGMKTAGETPHRIDFAYGDGSEIVQDFDYGDQPRGSDRTWSTVDTWNIGSGLFLRNRSPNKIANDVVVTMQDLYLDMTDRLLVSKDDISYGSQVAYTEIQPLETVGPVYVKHAVSDDTTMGLYAARLKLVVGSWV